jgi:hypothetical protein
VYRNVKLYRQQILRTKRYDISWVDPFKGTQHIEKKCIPCQTAEFVFASIITPLDTLVESSMRIGSATSRSLISYMSLSRHRMLYCIIQLSFQSKEKRLFMTGATHDMSYLFVRRICWRYNFTFLYTGYCMRDSSRLQYEKPHILTIA